MSNKVDLEGGLVETCHKLLCYQAQVFPGPEGCCPPARESLVGAEGDKCRRREISFLVRSQVDRVEGHLSGNSIAICKGKVLKSTQNVATENTIPRFWEMF